jgi:hypothetical protein
VCVTGGRLSLTCMIDMMVSSLVESDIVTARSMVKRREKSVMKYGIYSRM